VCVRLAKIQPDVGQPLLKLSRQPWTRSKTANEECGLFIGGQKRFSRGLQQTDRVGSEPLAEVSLDSVDGGLDRGLEAFRNLCSGCVKV